jgi:hypothetical protein
MESAKLIITRCHRNNVFSSRLPSASGLNGLTSFHITASCSIATNVQRGSSITNGPCCHSTNQNQEDPALLQLAASQLAGKLYSCSCRRLQRHRVLRHIVYSTCAGFPDITDSSFEDAPGMLVDASTTSFRPAMGANGPSPSASTSTARKTGAKPLAYN